MKVLHIIHPDKKFLRPIVEFIALLLSDEHEILYLSRADCGSNIQEDLAIPQQEIFIKSRLDFLSIYKFLRNAKKYNFVIFHSLFLNLALKFAVVLNRDLLKRIVWIAFGADLYTVKFLPGLKNCFHAWCNAMIANHCIAFVGIFPPDCEVFKHYYKNSVAKVFYAPYTGPRIPSLFLQERTSIPLKEKIKSGEPIVIQIGHNGMETLNHVATLRLLKKFDNENIRILLPLSYGGKPGYIQYVKDYAEKCFPGKVIALTEMLPLEQYNSIIQNVDICIFNTLRQAGLGNIHTMIWSNVKLYMPEESVMYHFFVSKGVPIQNMNKINTLSFKQFVEYPMIDEPEKFASFKYELTSMQWRVDRWNEIFSFLRNLNF